MDFEGDFTQACPFRDEETDALSDMWEVTWEGTIVFFSKTIVLSCSPLSAAPLTGLALPSLWAVREPSWSMA